MFVAPGTFKEIGSTLTREAAETVARNWWMLLLNGLVLVAAGIVIFSFDWSTRSLATFVGVVFILEGISTAVATGFDGHVRLPNVVTGLLSIATGAAVIAWPSLGIGVLGAFMGLWLIVVGAITIAGSLAARPLLPDWWLLLIVGVLEVPLGVLALASPGDALAALVTIGGIWAVAVGVMRVVLAFQLRDLPRALDDARPGPAAA